MYDVKNRSNQITLKKKISSPKGRKDRFKSVLLKLTKHCTNKIFLLKYSDFVSYHQGMIQEAIFKTKNKGVNPIICGKNTVTSISIDSK